MAEDGALLVSDTYNKVIWRVAGETVTQYAGAISVAGLSGEPTAVYHDAVADKAYFKEPWDVQRFLSGYAVTDAAANVVRYIMDGRVYTLAGSGKEGSADGADKTASFQRPTGLTSDADGTFYVADTGNSAVRVIRGNRVDTVKRASGTELMPNSPRGAGRRIRKSWRAATAITASTTGSRAKSLPRSSIATLLHRICRFRCLLTR